jgi:hypothetical protein
MLINEMDEFARGLVAAHQHANKMAQMFTGSMKPWLDQQKRLTEQLSTFLGATTRISTEMQKANAFVGEVARTFNELPPRQRHALTVFAQHGWFLDPRLSFPDIWHLTELFETGQAQTAHAELCDHFESRLDEIEQKLATEHPKRAVILSEAFDAHRQGKFSLSTIAFLAQADGICRDLIGEQLYRRRNGVSPLAALLDIDKQLPFNAAFLYPLIEPMLPLTMNETERANLKDALNRHAVLHGESTDYGTRLNSCRSLSVLTNAAWILALQKKSARLHAA